MASTKAETINSIYSNLDLQEQESTTILESLLEIMKRILESGEDILISGFDKYSHNYSLIK